MELYLYKVLKMEIRNRDLILIILFFVFISVEPVTAFNFGTLQKSTVQNITVGDTGQFEILLWNTDDVGYEVKLESVSLPKNWVVMFNPEDLYLDDTYSGIIEHLYLPRIKSTVDAAVLSVYVFVPESEKLGKHIIVLKAISGNDEDTSGFSLKQERLFFFEVNVIKDLYQNRPNNGIDTKTVSVGINQNIIHQVVPLKSGQEVETDVMSPSYVKSMIILFGVLSVIVIAWRIYRYD